MASSRGNVIGADTRNDASDDNEDTNIDNDIPDSNATDPDSDLGWLDELDESPIWMGEYTFYDRVNAYAFILNVPIPYADEFNFSTVDQPALQDNAQENQEGMAGNEENNDNGDNDTDSGPEWLDEGDDSTTDRVNVNTVNTDTVNVPISIQSTNNFITSNQPTSEETPENQKGGGNVEVDDQEIEYHEETNSLHTSQPEQGAESEDANANNTNTSMLAASGSSTEGFDMCQECQDAKRRRLY